MKRYRTLSLTAIGLILGQNLMAAPTEISGQELIDRYNHSPFTTSEYMVALVLLMGAFMLILLVILLMSVNVLTGLKRQSVPQEAEAKPRLSWMNVFGTKGQKMDDDEGGHEYDGIKEFDNNPPAWFNWLFYGTISWAFLYLMYFHVLGLGKLPLQEYAEQQKKAEVLLAAAQEKAIRFAEMPPFTDTEHLDLGQQTFKLNCAQCHGDKGQGGIGPNLADEYWLHGGAYKDVFKTIFNGVPEKGMLSWKKSLKPEEIRAVASYVHKLRGTNPPDPKAPQGEKIYGRRRYRHGIKREQ